MDIYRGDDLTLPIVGLPSGSKAVEAVIMTDGAAQLKMPVSGDALHIEAANLAKLASGVVCYALRYYTDEAAYTDGCYNQTAVTATSYYLRDCQQNGGDISLSELKKQLVAALKDIQGGGGVSSLVYRLLPGALVYKADTTAVSLSLLKTEGESTAVSALPAGWVVRVTWYAAGGLTKNAMLHTLAAINPNSLAGATSVKLTLYTGNPAASGSNAQVVDSATLLLVADGKKGDKGDDGTLTNYPIETVSGSELVLSDIYPNRIYKAGTCANVSVGVVHYTDGTSGSDFSAHGSVADEYVLDFVAGASCQVSLPAALKWAFTPSFSEGKRYVISIVDNLAIAAEFNAE